MLHNIIWRCILNVKHINISEFKIIISIDRFTVMEQLLHSALVHDMHLQPISNKGCLSWYGDFQHKDKIFMRVLYLYGNPYTGKKTPLCWDNHFSSIRIPIVNIRWSHSWLYLYNGNTCTWKNGLIIETGSSSSPCVHSTKDWSDS